MRVLLYWTNLTGWYTMATKTGKKPDKEPDKIAQNEQEKQAEIIPAHQPHKKIYLAVVLLALVVLGCAVIIGSNLLNASQSPTLPSVTNTTPTALPKLPDVTDTILPALPKLPAGTTTTLTAFFFYGNGCAACVKVKPIIADMQAKYPELHIEQLEVNDNRTNLETFVAMRQQYGVEGSWFAIPSLFIGKKALIGVPDINDHFEENILAEKQRIATGNHRN